ncbi:hypothetical protein AK812_SmicGene43302 [Symbiodinium microadriaticum]|uniref:Uncharacterized protein n=1 Tax=Symbiodinium microadriaticum TaxID=2951 RepID=A0A1Q9C1C6_SYMMI|nr:hypothetical protein AK812_SmicGene43302 [Symbiodinium microadriaticum]
MALAAEPWLPSRHGLCGAALHVVFFVLLVGVALLVGGMDRGGDLPAAEPATHPPWTDEEIAERRAEAWGNVTWSSPWSTWPGWEENAPPSANVHLQAAPTESTPSSGVTLPPPSSSSSAPSTGMTFPSLSSSPQEVPLQAGSAMSLSPVHHDLQDSTWDENISLGLQEEEVHLAGGWGDRGPLAPIPEDVPPPFGLPGPAASSDAKPMDLINQEADNVSLDKLLDVRPLRGRRPLRADGLSPLPLGRDPSSLATPKNSGQLRPGEIDWSSPGITRRGSSVRPGIDRWHHLDGTIRYRLREQQGNASGGQASGSAPQTCAKDDESGTGGASSSASSWTSTSFYPAKQVQSGREEKEALQETSTCDTGRGDISSTAVSSNSSCTEVGFWRHGEWHARERTPQEARLHRGGNGPQRSHRKQQRMNSYFQGEWRPAWLEKYIEDRNKRSQAAEIQEPARPQSASDLADTAPTSSTDVDPWSGQWTGRDDSWWGSSTWGVTSWFSWNASWSWTSSTTTAEPTMEVPQELPPNHGLFPDVGPALPPAPPNPWLLQLTGAERRLLQEGGVPELPLERIDLLLECLEDHQAAEHGAEARWALARLARRLEDALDSLQLVLEILVRRLQPRGYLPVVRTPATRAEQVRLLDWMRRSTSFLAETLEYHLQSPLESSEVNLGTPRVPWASSPESHGPGVGQHGHASDNASGGTGAASSSSSSPALRTAGSEEPVRSRSRSPVPVPSAMEMGVDAYGYDICLMPSASNQECGPQHDTNAWLQHSPMMQRVLEGELMGIWSEPDAEIDTSSTTTAPMDIDDFTTMVGDFFVVYLDVSEHVGEPLHALSWDPDDCLDNYLDSLEYFLHLLDDCGGDYFFAYLDVEFFYFDFVQYHDYDALDEWMVGMERFLHLPHLPSCFSLDSLKISRRSTVHYRLCLLLKLLAFVAAFGVIMSAGYTCKVVESYRRLKILRLLCFWCRPMRRRWFLSIVEMLHTWQFQMDEWFILVVVTVECEFLDKLSGWSYLEHRFEVQLSVQPFFLLRLREADVPAHLRGHKAVRRVNALRAQRAEEERLAADLLGQRPSVRRVTAEHAQRLQRHIQSVVRSNFAAKVLAKFHGFIFPDTGRVLWMKVGEWVASELAKKQEFRDKFAENYDKAKALEQAKVQGAKRAHATVSKEQALAAKQLFQDQLQEHYKAAEAQFFSG